jgi:hypothetical protein
VDGAEHGESANDVKYQKRSSLEKLAAHVATSPGCIIENWTGGIAGYNLLTKTRCVHHPSEFDPFFSLCGGSCRGF